MFSVKNISPESILKATPHVDLTWLLARAAQRLRVTMEEQAGKHGLDLRGYLLLTALGFEKRQTQLELAQALGLDKTTMTVLVDRLEREGFLIRTPSASDRRARIPQSTDAGRAVQAKIARAVTAAEKQLFAGVSAREAKSFRAMLLRLIGDGELAGSCV